MNRPRLSQIALIYLRIGNLTFGGGDPTIAALQRELVERKQWLTPEQFGLSFSLARVTPGTNLLAFCAGAAWFLLGWMGAVVAVVAATVPAAILAVWLTRIFESSKSNPLASAAISGSLAAAVGMMIAAAWLLARPRFRPGRRLRAAVLVGTPAILLLFFHFPPVAALGLAALVGLLWK
jgi:chromate transporter